MKLHYYRDASGNFGDDLNPWLWGRLLGDVFDGREPLFLGVGTLLNDRLPRHLRKVVFGSGAGYGAPPTVDELWTIYCVRGPLTAAALGIDPSLACTDAALLLRLIMPPSGGGDDVVFIPHHVTAVRAELHGVDLRIAAGDAGFVYVDPRWEVPRVLAQLATARLVVANAMHGAIVADALRVPWVPVRIFSHEDRQKWLDWTASMYVPYAPVEAPTALSAGDLVTTFREADRRPRVMSAGPILDERLARMARLLDQLRRDLDDGRFDFGGDVLPDDARWSDEDPGRYWSELMAAATAIERALPPGSPFALIDDQTWGGADFMPGRSFSFPAVDGIYQGPPATDQAALAALAGALDGGIRHLVIAPSSRWWLEHYEDFARHLETAGRVVAAEDGMLVFELAAVPGSDAQALPPNLART